MEDPDLRYQQRVGRFDVEGAVVLAEQLARNGLLADDALQELRGLAMSRLGHPGLPREHEEWARDAISRLSRLAQERHGDSMAPRPPQG